MELVATLHTIISDPISKTTNFGERNLFIKDYFVSCSVHNIYNICLIIRCSWITMRLCYLKFYYLSSKEKRLLSFSHILKIYTPLIKQYHHNYDIKTTLFIFIGLIEACKMGKCPYLVMDFSMQSTRCSKIDAMPWSTAHRCIALKQL